MALLTPKLENGWLSRVMAEPDKSFASITAQTYNPYSQDVRREQCDRSQSCKPEPSRA